MNLMPLVSFVVPCYNYGRYLAECLASIVGQQDETNFEIIAINDASTDDTAEILNSLGSPRLHVVHHETNRGHVATVNEGVALARGAFIARIDPDDRYRPDFLATLLPSFEQFPEVGLVYGDAAVIDERGITSAPSSDRVHHGRDFKGNELIPLLGENYICAPTAIGRRDLWLEALPIPEGLAFNDWYFNLMFARRSEFYYMNRVVADYRVHSTNHHSQIIRNRTEEPSIFSLLDKVFMEQETSADLEDAKQRVRSRVYARHYLTLADKYFGMRMDEDARRCYLRAIRHDASHALKAGVQRRLLETLIGRQPYDAAKSAIKNLVSQH